MDIAKSGDIGPSIVPTLITLSTRKKQANVNTINNDEKSLQGNLKPQPKYSKQHFVPLTSEDDS